MLLLLTALLGGSLLVAADLSTLYEVDVLTVTKGSVTGHAQHGYAVALVGLAALPMAFVARRGLRPAMLALAGLGLAALLIAAIAGDFHDVRSSGLIGRLYENASAAPQRGFYFETLGGVLLVASGLASLLLPRRPPSPPPPATARAPGPVPAAQPSARARARAAAGGAAPVPPSPPVPPPPSVPPPAPVPPPPPAAAEPRPATRPEPEPDAETWF